MKLAARDLPAYFRRPDPDRPGLLIYGADPMRVAMRRQEAVAGLVGPQGEAEMRLDRLDGADLRRDPAMLADAVRATGFFPGPRVVLVQEAGDGAAPAIAAAMEDWRPGDAQIVVEAGALARGSKLRKLFEDHPAALAAAIYDDPLGRDEIAAILSAAGIGDVGPDAERDLAALAQTLDPGDFRQTVEKLALFKLSDPRPVTGADVAAVAPASLEADLDDALDAVAEARTGEIGPILSRLESQGVTPVTLCIGATRHFRALYAAASDPAGPQSGIGRLRPPVMWKRRDRMVRQAQRWGAARLETALHLLTEADLQLRSSAEAPPQAVIERCLIRVAMLGGR